MKLFHDPRQALHAPARELHNGDWVPYAECPERLASVLASLGPVEPVADRGMAPLLAVHTPDYLAFLETAHDRWLAAGRQGDAVGYTFPRGRQPVRGWQRIDAMLGAYGFDAATPIAAGTWQAAYWSAQGALAAVEAVAGGGAPHAFALCRPPGHHAGADYMGGYCYLNNVAIAARAAQAAGAARVAVLDVDYHHGNGTQDIFWQDGEVFFASLHADPLTDYPFFWGHADEVGEGAGAGTTLNLPLPRGTAWESYKLALLAALTAIERHRPDVLLVSFGADTFAEDPISHFRLEREDYIRLAAVIAGLGLPTVVVMEGGYCVPELGRNVAAFLDGFS